MPSFRQRVEFLRDHAEHDYDRKAYEYVLALLDREGEALNTQDGWTLLGGGPDHDVISVRDWWIHDVHAASIHEKDERWPWPGWFPATTTVRLRTPKEAEHG